MERKKTNIIFLEGQEFTTPIIQMASEDTKFKQFKQISSKKDERALSVTELETADHLCRAVNYQKTIRLLDFYYGIVKRKILRYQSPTTGLFPSRSDDEQQAYIRDSIYCAAAIWALYQAYRRIDDDRGKSYELGQSAVKCMRGILFCWMNQADLLENFKKTQLPEMALHSKFHLVTGEPIASTETYGHMQIDVPALYLIYLVQMITSGLQIVYSMDEVCLIQNLVYYIERAYRTPDYGMWERGSKYNNGTTEVHASSIGMVKAALEAVNGCNLFGERGTAWSVVYVDIDAHNRNRNIFETLLPRESSSKNTDAALLPAITFPAFGTHDETLYERTKSKIIRKLKGDYGFKRHLRDGFGTVLENKYKRFYDRDEVKNFENIECEWPMFYIYLIIDGVFKSLPNQVAEYQKLLHEKLRHDHHNDVLVPRYYSVPEDCIAYEKEHPGSNPRVSSEEGGGETNSVFLWGQSLYIISQLLVEDLLHINELDPIRRYLPSFCRPRRTGRYSAFQGAASGTAKDLVVQVVLLAESMRLQAMMATYGIQTQTPHEVEPVQIWSQNELVKAYKYLGVNDKLKLSGRPARPMGALGTSKIYRLLGHTVLCYPLLFEIGDFYLSHDMSLLIDDIKTELHFVGRYWRLSGRPTVCLLIREEHMRDAKFKEMVKLFAMLKSGVCNSLQVQVGRVQNLISSSCVEHLDFLHSIDDDILFKPFQQLIHASAGYQSLTDIPLAIAQENKSVPIKNYENLSNEGLVDALRCQENLQAQCQLLGLLYERNGLMYGLDKGLKVKDRLLQVMHEAGVTRQWQIVRYCSSLLKKLVESISPYITAILVNGKQMTLGIAGEEEVIINRPIGPSEAWQLIYANVGPGTYYHAVLQQEAVLYIGKLISTQPSLFAGMLVLRIGWIIRAMMLYMDNLTEERRKLEELAPSIVRRILVQVLNVNEWKKNPKCTPYLRRQIEGALRRVPNDFYTRVWGIMTKASGGIIVAGHSLPQQPTIANMTMQEMDFSLMIEGMLNRIKQPDHRQIVVELIVVLSVILERNPEIVVDGTIDTDKMVQDAIDLYHNDHKEDRKTDFYAAAPAITSRFLARAVVNFVLREGSSTVLQMSACDVM